MGLYSDRTLVDAAVVKGGGTTVDSHAQILGLRDRKNPVDFSSGRLTMGEIAVLSPRAVTAAATLQAGGCSPG